MAATTTTLAQSEPEDQFEVVVTARKQAESLADVPLAISVVDRSELRRAGIDSLQGLAGQVPGLYFESMWGGEFAAPTLRGQAQPSQAGDNVGVFVDGVYQADNSAVDVPMLDLDRIEVVKGPQSALYGHSTFAGAINYVTRGPTAELTRELDVEAGTNAYRALSGALSGPLLRPDLLGRASFELREFDGTGVNRADLSHNLGGYRKWAAAGTLEYAPSASWKVSGNVRTSQSRLGQPAVAALNAGSYNCGSQNPVTGLWSFFCGNVPITDRFDISPGIPDSSIRLLQASVRLETHASHWSLDSLTAYYRSHSESLRDFDASSAGELFGVCNVNANCSPDPEPQAVSRLVSVNQVSRDSNLVDEISQEFRLRLHAGRFRWLLGAEAFRTRTGSASAIGAGPVDLGSDERLTALLPAAPLSVGPVSILNRFLVSDANLDQILRGSSEDSEKRSTALFGSLDYALSALVNIHAELRATHEWIRDTCPTEGCGSLGDPVSFDTVTPRVSIDAHLEPAALAWLSAARGARSGGSNDDPTLIPSEQSFQPESNWTYELGFRGGLWNGRLQLDTAVYYIDWQNTQIDGPSNSPGDHSFVIRNISGIRTRGIESAIDLHMTRQLSAAVGFSFVDPRFKPGSEDVDGISFCGITATNSASSFCTVGPTRNSGLNPGLIVPYIDGNVLQRAPQQQWSAALTYEAPATATGLKWYVRTSLEHQGKVYLFPIDGAYNGERTLLGARIGLSHGAWSLDFWGSNLTDVIYVRAVASRPPAFFPTEPRPQDLVFGDRRRLGVGLHFNF